MSNILPSFELFDIMVGISGTAIVYAVVYTKKKNAKLYRRDIEYGSARWGILVFARIRLPCDTENGMIFMFKKLLGSLAVLAVFFMLTTTIVFAGMVNVSNEIELRMAVADAGITPTTIALTRDIELVSDFIIPDGATITLTSTGETMRSLIATRDMDVIRVESANSISFGGDHRRATTLILHNIEVSRVDGTGGSGILNNGSLVMVNGRINGHTGRFAAGVTNTNVGIFTMYGGDIRRNDAGVRVSDASTAQFGGTFNMYGGTISENNLGVQNTNRGDTFTIYGGWVFNNFGVNNFGDRFGQDLDNGGTGRMPSGSVFINNLPMNPSGGAIGSGPPPGVTTAVAPISIPTPALVVAPATSADPINTPPHTVDQAPIPTDTPPAPVPDSPTQAPAAAGARTATPSAQSVLVNGQSVAFQAYNIDGSNYFRLRDLAYTLNGTSAQFNVGWHSEANVITLTSNHPYTPIGGEMAQGATGVTTAVPTDASVLMDLDMSDMSAYLIELSAYNIGGNNFFMLRDIADLFGFNVDWNATTNTIQITTN